jgi:hypothetical protein
MSFLRSVPAEQADRYDIYVNIHKGLRVFMSETLTRIGRLDVDNDRELSDGLHELNGLLDFCEAHIAHENTHIHPALEAARAGASDEADDDHVAHGEGIVTLRRMVEALMLLQGQARRQAVLRLYRQLAVFVGENLLHMHHEETEHNAVLWAAYSDAELLAIEGRIVASLSPEAAMTSMRWMVPAMSPADRLVLLGPLADMMPPPQFEALMACVRPHLPVHELARLEAGLRRAA